MGLVCDGKPCTIAHGDCRGGWPEGGGVEVIRGGRHVRGCAGVKVPVRDTGGSLLHASGLENGVEPAGVEGAVDNGAD